MSETKSNNSINSQIVEDEKGQQQQSQYKKVVVKPVEFESIKNTNRQYLQELYELRRAKHLQQKKMDEENELNKKEQEIQYWKNQCQQVYSKETQVLQKLVEQKDKEIELLNRQIIENQDEMEKYIKNEKRLNIRIDILEQKLGEKQISMIKNQQEKTSFKKKDIIKVDEINKLKTLVKKRNEQLEVLNRDYSELQKKYQTSEIELEKYEKRKARAISLKDSINKPGHTFTNLNPSRVQSKSKLLNYSNNKIFQLEQGTSIVNSNSNHINQILKSKNIDQNNPNMIQSIKQRSSTINVQDIIQNSNKNQMKNSYIKSNQQHGQNIIYNTDKNSKQFNSIKNYAENINPKQINLTRMGMRQRPQTGIKRPVSQIQ